MGMNVGNCPGCGRVYVKNLRGLCPNCLKELDKQCDLCLDYLRQYKTCDMDAMSEGTGVPERTIARFIREGKLSIKNNPNMTYECEVCGGKLRDGSMCDTCRQRLAKDVGNMGEDAKRREAERNKNTHSSFSIKERTRD